LDVFVLLVHFGILRGGNRLDDSGISGAERSALLALCTSLLLSPARANDVAVVEYASGIASRRK
jgi:hypothetical protein